MTIQWLMLGDMDVSSSVWNYKTGSKYGSNTTGKQKIKLHSGKHFSVLYSYFSLRKPGHRYYQLWINDTPHTGRNMRKIFKKSFNNLSYNYKACWYVKYTYSDIVASKTYINFSKHHKKKKKIINSNKQRNKQNKFINTE